MKKWIAAALTFAFCLSLCACGVGIEMNGGGGSRQDSDVKKVMDMIDGLGEITPDSLEALQEVQNAYDALTENQMYQVSNLNTLLDAWDRYYFLAIVGQWHSAPTPWDFAYDEEPDVVLLEDGTFRMHEYEGTWRVERYSIYTNDNYWGDIVTENGEVVLNIWGGKYIPLEDYKAQTENAFLTVEIADADLTEYLGFTTLEYQMYDAWDEPTGETWEEILFTNKLYDQGWIYWGADGDMQFEVNLPSYTVTYRYADGRVATETVPAQEGQLINHYELNFAGEWEGLSLPVRAGQHNGYTVSIDLDLEEITFGRARGQIVFINKEFVKEIKEVGGRRCIVVEVNGETKEYESGYWDENNLY